ncbi:hypothetical protein A7U60_g6419 [Sanghuangporus baumii]|uniref:RING-type domain-containing protein n=1 Tax=Sanghuangporus baumii TaxID=108892 RepID=A0A9Q5NAK9_SANBA|nr:hypothetical protein A7U60_g6419 [Sanghuangporus baumii]
MLPARAIIRQRKDRSASPHSRITLDLPPRASTSKNRARSGISENDAASRACGRKRKISVLEYESESSTICSSKTGPRQRKAPKRMTITSLTGSSSGTATMSRKPKSLNLERNRHGVASASRATKRGLSERIHSAKKENREDRSCLNEDLDVKYLEQNLIGLQKEIDRTRKANEEQRKTIEDLRKELSMKRKQNNHIDKLKAMNKKSEYQLNMIQENLQCQICLELLYMPHTLVPCGHVFCLRCLQNWFRTAPRQDEGDVEVLPMIWRIKTCPFCRSRIYHRPVPLFVLKNIRSIFASNEHVDDDSVPSDPWEGIFPANLNFADQDGTDLSETDGFDSEIDEDSFSSVDEQSIIVITGSENDDSDEETESSSLASGYFNEMRTPTWAPARFRAQMTRDVYPGISADSLRLIQRGATCPMILRYTMRYEPDEGIVARTDEGAEIYLGWNILLSDNDSPDGRRFMEWVEKNIHEEPESWLREENHGHPVFRRLVNRWSRTELLTAASQDESGLDINLQLPTVSFMATRPQAFKESFKIPHLNPDEEDTLIHARITNDERPLRRLARKFHTYSSVAYPPIVGHSANVVTSLEEARESFLIELASFQLLLRKNRMVCDSERRQVRVYKQESQRIADERVALRNEIEELKLALERAQLERRRKIEYDQIAERINALPTREELDLSISALENDIQVIKEEHETLNRSILARKTALGALVSEIGNLTMLGKDVPKVDIITSRAPSEPPETDAEQAASGSQMDIDVAEGTASGGSMDGGDEKHVEGSGKANSTLSPTARPFSPRLSTPLLPTAIQNSHLQKTLSAISLSGLTPSVSRDASPVFTPVTGPDSSPLSPADPSSPVGEDNREEGEEAEDIEMGEVSEDKIGFKGKKNVDDREEGEASDESSELSEPPDE